MMRNYGHVFSMNVQKKLKEKINARIFVKVTKDDRLYVEIEKKGGPIFKKFIIKNFSEKFHNGFTSDNAADIVMKKFKQFISKYYFY